MARGVNKVILVGNLGNDPDTKYTQGGMAICTISLATSSVRKDKDGQQIEKTEWHRIKLFGKLGEIADQYLRKGGQVYIEGHIEYGSYDKDGVKHYTTDIIAEEMRMLGGRGDSGGQTERPGSAPRRSQAAGAPVPRPSGSDLPVGAAQRPAQAPAPAQQQYADDFADDDIPF